MLADGELERLLDVVQRKLKACHVIANRDVCTVITRFLIAVLIILSSCCSPRGCVEGGWADSGPCVQR